MDGEPSDIFINFVRVRTDIVRLIGENVTLQADGDGRVYRGTCPFHHDQKVSFTVNSERQSYKCWVCNEGGDCFSYLMRHDNLNFHEALDALSRRAISSD